MISQKESKQARMGSWLLKLMLRDMETRMKTKIYQETIIKKYRKIKEKGNITPTMDHSIR